MSKLVYLEGLTVLLDVVRRKTNTVRQVLRSGLAGMSKALRAGSLSTTSLWTHGVFRAANKPEFKCYFRVQPKVDFPIGGHANVLRDN